MRIHKNEFTDWLHSEVTQHVLKGLHTFVAGEIEGLRGCESHEVYLRQDGFINGVERCIRMIEEINDIADEEKEGYE